jgi:hypothetical protein
MARSGAQENKTTPDIIAALADAIKASIMAGEFVAATDYPEGDRPQFWAAIARVRDDLPCVRPPGARSASSTSTAFGLGRRCSGFARARKEH